MGNHRTEKSPTDPTFTVRRYTKGGRHRTENIADPGKDPDRDFPVPIDQEGLKRWAEGIICAESEKSSIRRTKGRRRF